VVGIIGQNGTGKSSLVEAIAWAVYGNESAIVRTSKEGVKSAGAAPGEDCSVMLDFELSGDDYRLTRAMRGPRNVPEATLSVNGHLAAKGESQVTEEMERRLGMDYKAFFISVFARQKELNALSTLRSNERKKMVLRMLGVDVLVSVVADIDKDARLAEKELETIRGALQTPDGRIKREVLEDELGVVEQEAAGLAGRIAAQRLEIEAVEGRRQAAATTRDALGAKDEAFRALQRSLVERRTEGKDLRARTEHTVSEIAALQKKQTEMERLAPAVKEFEALSARRDELEAKARAFEARRAAQESLGKVTAQIEAAAGQLEEKRKALAELKDPAEHLEQTEKNVLEIEESQRENQQRIAWIRSESERLRRELARSKEKMEEIARLGKDSKCPTCEREMGGQHTFLLQKLGKEAEEREADLRTLASDLAMAEEGAIKLAGRKEALEKRRLKLRADARTEIQLASSIEGLEGQISTKEAERSASRRRLDAMGSLDFDENELTAVKRRVSEVRRTVDRFTELRAQVERRPVLEEERERLERVLRASDEEVARFMREEAALGYAEGDLGKAQAELDAITSEMMRRTEELGKEERALSALEWDTANRRGQLQEVSALEKRGAEATRKLEEQTVLSQAMKDFKANIESRIVPTLSEVSSALFAELTDSKYAGMEIDEDYEVQVYDKGQRYPLSRFSGGESDLANLCLRLAISRVIADRSGSSLNFLILDEIFGSQDAIRKRSIMSAFNQLSKQFRQILLITHIEDVKDLMSSVLVVKEREDGSSGVEVLT
jgi:exonuclease SbcC